MNVADRILASARADPDAVAVRQWDQARSYRQIVAEASRLAATLTRLGAGPETRVGVHLARTPALVSTVVGTVLAGAAYVVLDPASPHRRLRALVTDAAAPIVVTDDPASWAGAPVEVIGPPMPGDGTEPEPAPCPAVAENLLYVLYTSGSTGQPKGVLTTHANVLDYALGCVQETGIGRATRTLAGSALGFDAATIDLLVTLMVGGSVQLASDADRLDPARLTEFVTAHRVNFGFLTPTVLSLLDPANVPEWTTVLSGGEVVPPDLVRRWAGPGTGVARRFINIYGPTETTVCVTTAELDGEAVGPVPIGTPTPRHRAYVVDRLLRPVPAGERGELVVGGPGIARGYLGSPARTAEKFVPDPFATEPGARLYRTGDLASVRPDGSLGYHGRLDRQVKVSGQRIEPGEIEAVLREHPDVHDAAVEASGSGTAAELVAFLAPAAAPADGVLAAYAGKQLPPTLVPTRWVRLESLPRNTSGKLDRAQLLDSLPAAAAPAGTRDTDSAEDALAVAWREFLGTEPAPDADFVADGGNSITAMRLVAALRNRTGKAIGTSDIFGGRTPSGIAGRIAGAAALPGARLRAGNPPALSPPQRRLWLLDQLAPASAPYNIAIASRLYGDLHIPALATALRAVATKHDVLRWRIPQVGGEPYAVVDEPGDAELPITELTPHREQETRLRELLATDAASPFDLAAGPVWRVRLYRLGESEHVLAIVAHHAVFDGWSQAPLYADLALAYRAALRGERPRLAPLAGSYADYAALRTERDRENGDANLDWWAGHLAGAPDAIELPRDRPRPAVATYAGAEAGVRLTARADADVARLATRLGSTSASVLLGAFTELLHRLTGSPESVLGIVVADRPHTALADTVGFFVDTVPARLGGGRDVNELVLRCAEELRAVTAHPSAPLERIVDRLGVAREPGRGPLVQVLFNVLNFACPVLELDGLECVPVEVDKPGSPFDLTLYVTSRDGRTSLESVYNPDLFDPDRIQGLLADLAELAGALAASATSVPAEVAPHLPRRSVRTAAPGAMAGDRPQPQPAPAVPEAMTSTERLIADVWSEVLEHDSVRPSDNFFDIGGHSLAAAAVHARLVERTARNIQLLDLFRYPNVRALARFLDGAAERPQLARAAARAAARRDRTRARRPRAAQQNQEDTT